MSEVKISLKNGREVSAENCRETKDQLICEKMGGTFEIDKEDILDFRTISAAHEKLDESPEQEAVPAGEGKKEEDKSAAETDGPEKPAKKPLVRGTNPEQEKRLDEITQRKLELKQQGDQLAKDREQLQQDAKNMGTTYTDEQLDAINKRMAEVDEKISKFNKEVKELNEEEAKIIGDLSGQ